MKKFKFKKPHPDDPHPPEKAPSTESLNNKNSDRHLVFKPHLLKKDH